MSNHGRRDYSRISRAASRMVSINGFQPLAQAGPRWLRRWLRKPPRPIQHPAPELTCPSCYGGEASLTPVQPEKFFHIFAPDAGTMAGDDFIRWGWGRIFDLPNTRLLGG